MRPSSVAITVIGIAVSTTLLALMAGASVLAGLVVGVVVGVLLVAVMARRGNR